MVCSHGHLKRFEPGGIGIASSVTLGQAKVQAAHIEKLGGADCDSAAVFGHFGKTDEKFWAFLKKVLNLDPDARGRTQPRRRNW